MTGQQIVPLPEKETIVHRMKLGPEENKVYQEVSFIFQIWFVFFIYFLALKQTFLTSLTSCDFLNRDNMCQKSKQKQNYLSQFVNRAI